VPIRTSDIKHQTSITHPTRTIPHARYSHKESTMTTTDNSMEYTERLLSILLIDALKRLRQAHLLRKEDIRVYHLVMWWSCKPKSKMRFEYLIDWDPEALKEPQYDDNKLFHCIIIMCKSIDSFTLMLKAGLKHYPEELGFLFHKNNVGKTAFEMACTRYGKDEAWGEIEKCLEETTDIKMVAKNEMTNLYPFMLAAAGKTTELNKTFYLLRRDPEVLYRVNRLVDTLDCVERKRKRSS